MKWYKKQLQEMETSEKKSSKPQPSSNKKSAERTFDPRKTKISFPNPVSHRNRNRKKTDSIS